MVHRYIGAVVLVLTSTVSAAVVDYDMVFQLTPDTNGISAEVTVRSTAALPTQFVLHGAFEVECRTPGVSIESASRPPRADDFETTEDRFPFSDVNMARFYLVRAAAPIHALTLRYSGRIYRPPSSDGEAYARGFSQTSGTIEPSGVFLSVSSAYYPWFGPSLCTFRLRPLLPTGWHAVSQGTWCGTYWLCRRPQDEVYLVAAPFTVWRRTEGEGDVAAFLRSNDEALAEKYLGVTARYIGMYARLIGPYPYGSFALVENFWETGYGMPSFTLLGPTVIRLPFILHTSYPHEILHNWWGNSVYVDYATGNWCEGLTVYLADHLIAEQRNQGTEYRLGLLQKYADFVADGRDFPLTAFRARHGSASEAVGYGKGAMVFHMLRRRLGDDGFVAGLREFYRRHRFTVATFGDVQRAFETTSGMALAPFFEQWVDRSGAPRLAISSADVAGTTLELTLEQRQEGACYALSVPVAVTLVDHPRVHEFVVDLTDRRVSTRVDLPAPPVRVDVDPCFDLFRLPHVDEIPPALSGLLGARSVVMILPAAASTALRNAYGSLAAAWYRNVPVRMVLDTDVVDLPDTCAVWILGWQNTRRAALDEALAARGMTLDDGLDWAGSSLPRTGHAFVATDRVDGRATAFLAVDDETTATALARKLPHYHKYSYLAFEGPAAENVLKGRWDVTSSPLTAFVAKAPSARATVPPRTALATLPPRFSRPRMLSTVARLADEAMAGRGLGTEELDRAADLVAAAFASIGLEPGGDGPGTYFQDWTERTGEPERSMRLRNVIGVLRGAEADWGNQSVVVGAHYDHLGRGWPVGRREFVGTTHPGADDNGSGVAVVLEVARVLAEGPRPRRTVVVCAFTGEEAGLLGSRHYVATASRFPAATCRAMVNVDTVGRLGDRKLLILGTGTAREWVHVFRGVGYVTGVPLETVKNDVGSSDQTSFVAASIPAVQLFAGPHQDYHTPADTVDRIDGDGLVATAAVLAETIGYLAERDEPLTKTMTTAPPSVPTERRRVGLGTMPDFTFEGPGVRIAEVAAGSPASKAGIRVGDIVTALDGRPIENLRAYADALRNLPDGATVPLRLERDGGTVEVRARVETR